MCRTSVSCCPWLPRSAVRTTLWREATKATNCRGHCGLDACSHSQYYAREGIGEGDSAARAMRAMRWGGEGVAKVARRCAARAAAARDSTQQVAALCKLHFCHVVRLGQRNKLRL